MSTVFDDHAGMPGMVKWVRNLKNLVPDPQKQSIREKNAIYEEKIRFLAIFLLSTAFDDHAGMPTLVKSVRNLKNRIPDAQKQSICEKNAIYEEKSRFSMIFILLSFAK